MKNIAVLIDFTEGSKIALKQAGDFVKETHGKLFALHIVSSPGQKEEAERRLTSFVRENLAIDTPFEALVDDGSLETAADAMLKRIPADLAIVCTHGIKGVRQHLFGANILKLVKDISCTSLVIQEQSREELINTKKILLPVGPHPDFKIKIEQTAALANLLNASCVIYEIKKPGSDFENLLSKHTGMAKTHFEENEIPYTLVSEEMNTISVGYSRQTIEYALKNNISIISLMATVSKNDLLFAAGDKENFLVNGMGISILACK